MAAQRRKPKADGAQCAVEGCSKPAWARTWCKMHYARWRIHGDAEKVLRIAKLPATCEVAGCDNPSLSRWKKGIVVCNPHWQMLYRHGQTEAPPRAPLDPLPLCSVHKCREEVRSRNAGLCEKHYARMRRNGDPEVLVSAGPLYRYVTEVGYVKLREPDHPLADSKGRVSEHRFVAFRSHNGECPSCFWCDIPLQWAKAAVDHLNEAKGDNRAENLVVACNACNRARGSMVPFVRRMKEEAIEVFVSALKLMRAGESQP